MTVSVEDLLGLSRESSKRGPTPETRLKRACQQLLKQQGIFNFALTQGLGSYPGLPDRVAHYRGTVYYFEMKTPTGRLSDAQKRFQKQCKYDDIEYHVIRSVDDIIEVLRIPCLFTKKR